MSEIEKLRRILDRLDLSPNEIEIYLTLIKSHPLNASEISDNSNVTKANVYSVIKRLIQKGFIEEQPKKKPSKYKAIPPKDVMVKLEIDLQSDHMKKQNDLQEITALVSKLDFNPDELIGSSPSDSVWLINSETRIKKNVLELLERAEKSILACVPTIENPLYIETRNEILSKIQDIIKKKKNKMHLVLNWELEEGTEDEKFANTITKHFGNVYQWGIGELPFSAFLIDGAEGLIILQSDWIPLPKYSLALWIRHASYVKPFEKLIERFSESGIFRKWV